jgi:hypothetical protein
VRVSGAVKPKDFIDEILVRDVVDLSWEGLRMRRFKAALLNAKAFEQLKDALNVLVGEDEAFEWRAVGQRAIGMPSSRSINLWPRAICRWMP